MSSISLYIILWIIHHGIAKNVRIIIEPPENVITRYVGDSVNLTCAIEKEEIERENMVTVDVSNIPNYSLNWILPSNGQDRVKIEVEREKVTVYINDLTEADHGNYTCNLIKENDVVMKKSSIYLGVLPKGRLSSCNDNSFFCDKNICIPDRYKCDGVPDCPGGLDESHSNCGPDPCYDKLQCDDKRCLSRQECCREPNRSPPNCSIHATIRCCRKLIHPAILDQDLYYLAIRPKVNEGIWYFHTATFLVIVGFVLTMAVFMVAIVCIIRFKFFRPFSPTHNAWHRHPPWSACSPQRLLNPSHHPTDQYLLQSSGSSLFDRPEYIRRIPGLRSELLSPTVLRGQSIEDSTIVLVPLSHSGENCGPPPSYQQVIGAPPPPYSSVGVSQTHDFEATVLRTVSSNSLLSNNNNNNGDINGNMTSRYSVAQNRNFTGLRNSSALNSSTSFGTGPSSTHNTSSIFSDSQTNSPSGYGFLHSRK